MATLILQGVITEDGKLEVELPEGMTPGAVEVEIREPEFEYKPLGDLLDTEMVGLWADRTDIGDTLEFADKLRRRALRKSDS
jgi:hypothetical protein